MPCCSRGCTCQDEVSALSSKAVRISAGEVANCGRWSSSSCCAAVCRSPRSWDRSEPVLATFMGPPGLPVMGPPACRAPWWSRTAATDASRSIDLEADGAIPGGVCVRGARGANLLPASPRERDTVFDHLVQLLNQWATDMNRREVLRLLGWAATAAAAMPVLHGLDTEEQARVTLAMQVPS